MIALSLFAMLAAGPTYSVDRIGYDGHSLIVDGKPTFMYGGAFHYFRCPKELWRDRFRAIKAAGMNAVETYVAWNWHERRKPSSLKDFSKVDMTDLKDWLKMAHEEFGLYTIVRPGPYICAEWARGGYPDWLPSLRPASVQKGKWFRGNDPVYLDWCRHWYDAVCKVVAPEQITKKPAGKKGVILFQIENEYDYWGGTEEARSGQLKALYDVARRDGIDVPIFGCWTHELRHKQIPGLTGVFDASNLYSRHDIGGAGRAMDELKGAQPDAPGMIAELQGGWFSGVGGELSEDQGGIGPDQIRAITLECIARGGTILSHYMLFGGTHFGDWGARGLTTTYDYFAPLREWGAVQDKYRECQAIARMLVKYGSEIAVSERVDKGVEENEPDTHFIVRRGPDGEHFVFIRNSSETQRRAGIAKVTVEDGTVLRVSYELQPFATDVVLVPAGEKDSWNGKRICVPTPQPERPATPPAVRVASAQSRRDPMPAHWVRRAAGASLEDTFGAIPGTTVYRQKVKLTRAQLEGVDTLAVKLLTDNACSLSVNGSLIAPIVGGGRRVEFPVKQALREGENEFMLVHEDAGRPNGGGGMEDLGGVERAFLTRASAGQPLTEWRVKLAARPQVAAMAASDYDDSGWDRLVLDRDTVAALVEGRPSAWPAATILNGRMEGAVYRTEVNLTSAQIASGLTTLVFDRIDDRGTIYVNGRLAGRHAEWDVPCEIDAAKLLHEGRNVVAVYVVNTEGEGGLTRGVRLVSAADQGVPVAFDEVGSLGESPAGGAWSTEALDSQGPVADKGGVPPAGSPCLTAEYRTEFELPIAEKGVWIPWRAVVRASGNGEMFLNGRSIGRYWEVGPQRAFFLPESWLNFGKGKRNVLSFVLRGTANGAKLEALEISPYPDSAEFRK